jgi:hypothetical protein
LQEELVGYESKCQGCPNLIKLDKTKNNVTTLIASLRVVQADLQFHKLLLKREHNRIKDGEVELKDVHEKLRSISRDLDVLHLKGGCMKQWVQSLGHQIQLMCKGSRMYVMPLLIENPTTLALHTTRVFLLVHAQYVGYCSLATILC